LEISGSGDVIGSDQFRALLAAMERHVNSASTFAVFAIVRDVNVSCFSKVCSSGIAISGIFMLVELHQISIQLPALFCRLERRVPLTWKNLLEHCSCSVIVAVTDPWFLKLIALDFVEIEISWESMDCWDIVYKFHIGTKAFIELFGLIQNSWESVCVVSSNKEIDLLPFQVLWISNLCLSIIVPCLLYQIVDINILWSL